ncbi:hypothetical protein LASUN_07410 [Lentilactobacillus sunkii]|jgi:hypothetical protein|uniref:D-alanyl-D-alanine carboxypeptidase n=1 Tax=Lentilactobacillus sunkii TaxID=481719 RepID=A0A1E7XGL2_9LACO|nr:hypothetical protein [Lentilactobacillus sunkii]OFA12189.1 hypothetical protein LASUN_07410 [Lentilactobacillus sunkii]
MKKWSLLLLSLGLGITILSNPTTHASSGYTVVKSSFPAGAGKMYHAANPKQNAYVWTTTKHTKKLANIKNYPNTSWHSTGTIVLRHNNKNAVYYRVGAVSPTKTKKWVSGWIWRGYLKPGYNPNFTKVKSIDLDIATNKEYNQFIKQSKYQQLTRDVLALFPNSTVSKPLSRYALFRDPKDKIVNNVATFKTMDDFLNVKSRLTNQQRLTKIKAILETKGYTTVKRQREYVIGIYLTNFQWSDQYATGDMHQGFAIGTK